MKKTFLAAALLPTAVATGIDAYFDMRNWTPSNERNYRIIAYREDCSGSGPFARISIIDENHALVTDFRPPIDIGEARRFARKNGYDPNFIETFRCED